MFTPTEVEARTRYTLWIRYADGEEGEVDLSHLAGRGVFSIWEDVDAWNDVAIGPNGSIRWSEEVALCPDATYMRLTDQSPEDVFPDLKVLDA